MAPVVDLARERRIAGKVAELQDLLDTGAVDADRTRAMLAGELEARPMTDDPDVSTSIRLPGSLLTRADALAAVLPGPPGSKLTRSGVIRAALERGLSGLEADASSSPPYLSGVLAELDALRARVEALTAAPLSELAPILSAIAHGPDPIGVACPACAAPVGAPCLSGGVELIAAHQARRALVNR